MCNLYSMTTNVEAIRRLFQVDASNDKSGNLPAMTGTYAETLAKDLFWHSPAALKQVGGTLGALFLE
jgi:hypothetical protein